MIKMMGKGLKVLFVLVRSWFCRRLFRDLPFPLHLIPHRVFPIICFQDTTTGEVEQKKRKKKKKGGCFVSFVSSKNKDAFVWNHLGFIKNFLFGGQCYFLILFFAPRSNTRSIAVVAGSFVDVCCTIGSVRHDDWRLNASPTDRSRFTRT